MEDFDHDNFYVLDGQHTTTGCDDCHPGKTFGGTPQECAGCHSEPKLHAKLFGQDCARCHSAVAWAPAQLKQHTFVLEHGEESIPMCETCHAGTYTEYPCYSCHDEEEMHTTHLAQENITEIQDCVACHPTGREGEVVRSDSLGFNPDLAPRGLAAERTGK